MVFYPWTSYPYPTRPVRHLPVSDPYPRVRVGSGSADELAEHGVVGVVDHFSDRRLIYRTEARALTSADDCLKAISIRCRTETVVDNLIDILFRG